MDTITVIATNTANSTRRVNLSLGLRSRDSGEPFLTYAPSYICSIDPADDLAKTFRPVNWESGVMSGAAFAVRRWMGDQLGLILAQLTGRLASDGIEAIALATAAALAVLIGHDMHTETNVAWDIQFDPSTNGRNPDSNITAVAGRAGV